jgi:hypothetical protein
VPGTAAAPALHFTPKARFLAGPHLEFCDEPRPLRRVYFLGDGSVSDIAFRRLSGSEAMVEWVKHSFMLDVEETPRLASQFNQLARLANEAIHFRLDYPRRYEDLGRVRESIIEHTHG